MALTALATLEQDLAKRLGGYASGTTNAGAVGASDLIDTSGDSPFSPSDTANRWKNAWVLITSGSSNNDLRAIGTYNAGTGFAAQRAFSASIISGVTYELYTVLPPSYFGIVEGLDYCINSALRALEDWRMIPLTLIPDGDMSATGVADWLVGASVTRAKVQATYPVIYASQGVWSGKWALYVDNASSLSALQSRSVNGAWGGKYWLEFVGKTVQGDTLAFEMRDTDGTTIANTAGTLPHDAFQHYSVSFSLPSTPTDNQAEFSFQIRQYNATRGRGYIDHVQLCREDQERYALPAWIVNKTQIAEVFKMDNRGGPADRLRFVPVYKWDAIIDPQGGSPMTLIVGPNVGGSLDDIGKNLWINARAPAETLSQRSDVTSVDSDLILAGAAARAYEFLARQANGDDRRRYQQLQKMAMLEFYHRRKSVQNKPSWKIQETSGWTAVF